MNTPTAQPVAPSQRTATPAGQPSLLAMRTGLMLPLSSLRFIPKAHTRGADAIVLDLEDDVAPSAKDQARALLPEAVGALRAVGMPILLRVNTEPNWLQADLAAASSLGLDYIVLPKVDTVEQLEQVTTLAGPVHVIAMIESPTGVLNAAMIATHPQVAGLLFGSEDYCAALGLSSDQALLDWPAQQIAVSARAAGKAAFGIPGSIAQLKNPDAFEQLARRGRNMGYTGCLCVHPDQVAAVNRAYAPSAAEQEWARAVLAAAESASYQEQGVVELQGRMIDAPVVAQARRILGV